MTSLESGFEGDLREAVLDEAESRLYGDFDPLAFRLLSLANQNFESYAQANDYDIGSIIGSGQVVDTSRSTNSVSATLQWGELSALFEYGVSPHVIEGNPTLSFGWDSPPEGTRPPGAPAWVETDQVNWGSVTGGIPESRAIRNALDELESGT